MRTEALYRLSVRRMLLCAAQLMQCFFLSFYCMLMLHYGHRLLGALKIFLLIASVDGAIEWLLLFLHQWCSLAECVTQACREEIRHHWLCYLSLNINELSLMRINDSTLIYLMRKPPPNPSLIPYRKKRELVSKLRRIKCDYSHWIKTNEMINERFKHLIKEA